MWNAGRRRGRSVRNSPRYADPLPEGGLGRRRERLYVDSLVRRYSLAWPDLVALRDADRKIVLRNLSVASLQDAGYFREGVMKKDGKPKRAALDRAESLLGMPRIQAAMDKGLSQAGLSLEECFLVMAEIAKDKDTAASDRLNALKMRFQLTTGFAPTKTAGVTTHIKGGSIDAFFQKDEFAKPPPMKMVTATIDQEDEDNE